MHGLELGLSFNHFANDSNLFVLLTLKTQPKKSASISFSIATVVLNYV
jgi:hypothetical protein